MSNPFLTFNEFINEGRSRWDGLAGKLVKEVFKQWIKDWKSGKKKSYHSIDIDNKDITFELECTIIFNNTKGFNILDSTGADSRDIVDDEMQDPYIIIDFEVNKDWLPEYWQDIYMNLLDVIRHEIEHITQGGDSIGNYKTGKPKDDDSFTREMIQSGLLPKHMYYLLPKEVDANLQGLRLEAKKRREAFKDSVDRYLNRQNLTTKEKDEVLNVWRKRAKQIGGFQKF